MNDEMELIKLLGTRYVQRRDVKAFQSKDGSWFPDRCDPCRKAKENCAHRPMTLQDFQDHLSGKKTMGHYMVDPATQTCKLFAFDIDIRKPNPKEGYVPVDGYGNAYNPREAWLNEESPEYKGLLVQVRALAEGFAVRVHNMMKLPVAISYTGGKGFHVYCFTGTIPADAAMQLAQGVMEGWTCFEASRGSNFWRYKHDDDYQDIEIETFPKQGHVDEAGFGNLMSLPLGINQKTGKTKFFITTRLAQDVIGEMNPVRALEGDLPWE